MNRSPATRPNQRGNLTISRRLLVGLMLGSFVAGAVGITEGSSVIDKVIPGMETGKLMDQLNASQTQIRTEAEEGKIDSTEVAVVTVKRPESAWAFAGQVASGYGNNTVDAPLIETQDGSSVVPGETAYLPLATVTSSAVSGTLAQEIAAQNASNNANG